MYVSLFVYIATDIIDTYINSLLTYSKHLIGFPRNLVVSMRRMLVNSVLSLLRSYFC